LPLPRLGGLFTCPTTVSAAHLSRYFWHKTKRHSHGVMTGCEAAGGGRPFQGGLGFTGRGHYAGLTFWPASAAASCRLAIRVWCLAAAAVRGTTQAAVWPISSQMNTSLQPIDPPLQIETFPSPKVASCRPTPPKTPEHPPTTAIAKEWIGVANSGMENGLERG